MKHNTTEVFLLALFTVTCIALEIICAYLAYETIGAIVSTLYFFAIGINLVFLVVAIRYRRLAAVCIFLLALAIVPYQLVLAQRLWRVQTEANRIVGFAYEQRLASGEYPNSLVDYRYRDLETRMYIQEFRNDATQGGFILCYHVGTESTSHCYSPKDGWTYYSD